MNREPLSRVEAQTIQTLPNVLVMLESVALDQKDISKTVSNQPSGHPSSTTQATVVVSNDR